MRKKGISLIVLVITIIVMIILSASIILSISNNDIMKNANKAKLLEAANVIYAEYDLNVKTGNVIAETAEEYVKNNLKNKVSLMKH